MSAVSYLVVAMFVAGNAGNTHGRNGTAGRAEANVCDTRTGPAGSYGCISIPRYQGLQYANCLTNAYIKQKSGGLHSCVDYFATYCWYQCMLENKKINSGPVTADCLCEENPDPAAATTPLPLPAKCYSPDGRDCTWYRECLEVAQPCGGHQAAYAVKYAEKYCLLYDSNQQMFSSQGQRWIDGVRKCLQVALVPAIRPYYTGGCEGIKQSAFASHALCYVTPGFGAPSMCNLGCGDWLSAFWTIKASFASEAYETVSGMLEVAWKCKTTVITCGMSGVAIGAALTTTFGQMGALALLLHGDTPIRPKRDMDGMVTEVDRYELSAKISDRIAGQLEWNTDEFDWFSFVLDENFGTDGNVTVNVWLLSKSGNNDADRVDKEIVRFNEWIASGKDYLNVEVNGTEFKPVTLSVCQKN